jgi:DNA-binding CsgD family transcriptional regulator
MSTRLSPGDVKETIRAQPRPQSIIARPRVLARLLEAASYPVILIVAPAGFGKTTAIRQLLSTRSNAVLITTPPAANTLVGFIHAFARGCSSLIPTMSVPPDELPANASNAEPELELYSAWAIANLRDTECTIAIDDLQHTAGDDNISAFLVRVTGACGHDIQWILSSRIQGSVPWAHWQAYGNADARITADDLRMTQDEAYDLSKALNSPISSKQLATWVELTRGFPVPLTYAIRASARRGNVDSVTGDMRTLTFNFLADHLWQSLGNEDRAILELAALMPPANIRDYERSGDANVRRRLSSLCDDVAFLTLSADGVFSMHDLFREFVKQRTSLRGIDAHREVAQRAAASLFTSGRYVEALELLEEIGDRTDIMNVIERTPISLDNLEIAPRLIRATEDEPLNSMQLRTLVLQTDYWRRCGSAPKALRHAEELLKRIDATSPQLLCALRAIGGFTHFKSMERHRAWLNRMPEIIKRLEKPERIHGLACQANYYCRYSELHSEARRVLQDIAREMYDLDSKDRLDTQIVNASTFLGLNDITAAIQTSREAVDLATALGDLSDIARTQNILGLALYGMCEPEYASIADSMRDIVSKAGAWRFAQTSHWIPAEYYARLGDAIRARLALSLHDDVILFDETHTRRLGVIHRISTLVCELMDENYSHIVADFSRFSFPTNADESYHIAIVVSFAHAFLGNDDQAAHFLSQAKRFREETDSLWEQRGVFDVFNGEVLVLCLIGRWTQANRLAKLQSKSTHSPSFLYRALLLLTDGPPFAGVKDSFELCLGKPYMGLTALLAKRVIDKWSENQVRPMLTNTEMDILRLVGLGRSNKDIAAARTRSAETVKRQVASIYKKLGVENRTSAVAIARERGLL